MTLDRQLEDARQALEALTTDEAELSRLASEQAAEIDALKAAGSRDFAHLASLEGKRAALTSMLEEQRAHVAQARALLEKVEAEHRREAQLVRAGHLAERTRAAWGSFDGALMAFVERSLPELLNLLNLQGAWDARRAEWGELAREMGASVSRADPEPHAALLDTLAARGVDVEALCATRYRQPGSLVQQLVSWPLPGAHDIAPGDGLDLRLKAVLQEAVIQAITTKGQVDARAQQLPYASREPDSGLFSHLPKPAKRKSWKDALNPEG